jgi:hypothetical protein
MLVMDVWQELEWTDPRLTWDDEPQNLRLPMSEVWTPDIKAASPLSLASDQNVQK